MAVALFLGFVVTVVVAGACTYGNHESLRKPVIRPWERERWQRLGVEDEVGQP